MSIEHLMEYKFTPVASLLTVPQSMQDLRAKKLKFKLYKWPIVKTKWYPNNFIFPKNVKNSIKDKTE